MTFCELSRTNVLYFSLFCFLKIYSGEAAAISFSGGNFWKSLGIMVVASVCVNHAYRFHFLYSLFFIKRAKRFAVASQRVARMDDRLFTYCMVPVAGKRRRTF